MLDLIVIGEGENEEGEGEKKEELILGKFKSQEDLVKSYQALEKKLGEGKQESGQKTEDMTKKAEEAVKIALEKQSKSYLNEVAEVLKDADVKDNFVAGLEAAGEDVKSWEKELNSGKLPASVVKKFAALGKADPEAKPISKDIEPKMTQNQALSRVMSLINTRAYVDTKHPEHANVRKEVGQLESKYKI